MPFNIFNAPIEELHDELLLQKKISLSVLRLDKIHPIVSGNKLFKLHYFIGLSSTLDLPAVRLAAPPAEQQAALVK